MAEAAERTDVVEPAALTLLAVGRRKGEGGGLLHVVVHPLRNVVIVRPLAGTLKHTLKAFAEKHARNECTQIACEEMT